MVKKIKYIELWWLLLIVIIAIFRIVVTEDREILALNLAHDDFWYINTAFNNIWGGDYNNMSFIHLPVYSMWLMLIDLLGIPARMAIDFAWLLSISYLTFAVYRLSSISWLAVLLFAFLAFHPFTINPFDRVLAGTLLTVISAAVIAAGIEIWNCREGGEKFRTRVAFSIYILGFAIAFHTRKEGIVLIPPLILLACWSVFDRQHWWVGINKYRLALPLLFAPLLSALLLGGVLAGGNYIKYGVWARYELAAPGYQGAMASLNHIDVGRTPRHITVTEEMLSLAYKESPTFRELQPFMEGPTGQFWFSISKQFTGFTEGIGNGWFYWAVRDVAAQAGWHANAIIADSKYSDVAEELEKAYASGRLKKRGFVMSSFLDPDLGKWMPEVSQSTFNVLQLVVQPMSGFLILPKENASAIQLEKYIAVTGKRKAKASASVSINGWVTAPTGTIIGLSDGSDIISSAVLSGPMRPDVAGAYPFSISDPGLNLLTELWVLSPDGRKGAVELRVLRVQATSFLTGELQAEVGIDSLAYSGIPRVDRWLPQLFVIYEWVGYIFCLAALAAIVILIVRRKALTGMAIIFILSIAMIAARTVLFGVLDASSWNGLQTRYVSPIIPAFACMGVFGIALLWDAIKKEIYKQRSLSVHKAG